MCRDPRPQQPNVAARPFGDDLDRHRANIVMGESVGGGPPPSERHHGESGPSGSANAVLDGTGGRKLIDTDPEPTRIRNGVP